MPSQLLQIRGIFPAALGMFAIRSIRLPWVMPNLDRPDWLRLMSPISPNGWALSGQELSDMRRRLAPPLAKPAGAINQTVSGYSPERIAEINYAPSLCETCRND